MILSLNKNRLILMVMLMLMTTTAATIIKYFATLSLNNSFRGYRKCIPHCVLCLQLNYEYNCIEMSVEAELVELYALN